MLANLGAIPGLVGRQDAVVLDEHAHSSMQEAAKIARANGAKVATFAHSDPQSLEQTPGGPAALSLRPGVHRRRLQHERHDPAHGRAQRSGPPGDAVLYIDDAHGTGVLGAQGRGTVLDALGSYDNTFVIGSLSKAFSCAGGFIGCPERFTACSRSAPAPTSSAVRSFPAISKRSATVIDILRSDAYETLRARLDTHIAGSRTGLSELGLVVMGGVTPIVSVLVGDEADTLNAGKFLFDRGYYVQSVLFPAVPYQPAYSACSATPITTTRRSMV